METISNNKIKILAVDDNPKNIQVIGSILRDAGYSVGFANDGQQALDLLSKIQDFDLVLLDVNMPIMDGFETCKAMRNNKNLKEIPVIFLTALNDPKDLVAGFEVGGQDYVTKPFNSKEILSRVKTHIDLKRNKDQLKKVNQWLEEKVEERTKELQKTNVKLEEANQELRELDKAKSDFLSLISHQIKTPLNGIIGFITVLKNEEVDSNIKEMIHYLEISANRLDRFASVSLKITELRTKKIELQKRDIILADLVESAQANLTERIKTKDISITYDGKLDHTVINGAQELVGFCFESVIKNAVNYSPNEGVIHVKVETDVEKTVCSFIDQGEGFNSDTLKNLFQLFVPSSEYLDENNGLDLALVKLIMDAHGGKIIATNNKEKGTIVSLIFPN
ncbi:hybrid sensor histidine kinase/response regulator [Ancylomarina euxinus]|uniref:histidine kinase n=1 Tax=Ancylomarina euxinus TaxID=2283627 RepID=A0A425Y071_9BACT|nr:hybrid sensor histidine kinase/response regulator [Ancylomarina euxinus]MCZ4695227.1 hybrid sensor histidine kinase/response regulator [Ancylomarina euxinus]MUP15424.1 response regulator [Ancylomarina euxinus]RRG21134.1 hybrid sensor histidine kinase/response regulator [Ancylomarina euxinus]